MNQSMGRNTKLNRSVKRSAVVLAISGASLGPSAREVIEHLKSLEMTMKDAPIFADSPESKFINMGDPRHPLYNGHRQNKKGKR